MRRSAYGIGFIKNRYVGRTFILPTQKERERAVHIKLNVLKAAVAGKRVVLVDDSIVRGTTTTQITHMLREAGATEVHIRISSPPFINPCYFGTDIDSKDKLIACRMSLEEIRKTLDADSLGYLSLEHLQQIAQVTTGCGFCMGCFTGITKPVLVSGTDGVGTKLKIAFMLDKHDTVGIDCVAMCVNDIICCGAKPLIFLDNIALGKNIPEKVADIVKGVADGCVETGCALVGGETAEMPGFYPVDEYDLAGFSVGVVDKDKMINPENVQPGDVLIALPSSGVHSNGFSLVRKVFELEEKPRNIFREFNGSTLGETLLTPTRLYVKPMLKLIDAVQVKSIVHVTGGGFYENIPRALNARTKAVIDRSKVRVLPVFEEIQKVGNISEHDMFNTFNMGVGMIAIVSEQDADKALATLKEAGEDAYVIGQVQEGQQGIEIL